MPTIHADRHNLLRINISGKINKLIFEPLIHIRPETLKHMKQITHIDE